MPVTAAMNSSALAPPTAPATAVDLPTHVQPIDVARFVPSLAKKVRGVTVYAIAAVSKFTSKWKKQPRLLVVTARMVLVCAMGGDVKRVIDLTEVEELAVQQDKTAALMLIKLAVLPTNEPDLLVLSSSDAAKNSHDPYALATLIATLAQASRAAPTPVPVKHLPEAGPIRSMTRVGHNPVSAKDKLKACSDRPQPATAPPARIALAPAPLNTTAHCMRAKLDASAILQLPFDSRATSDASGVTPQMQPVAMNSSDVSIGLGDVSAIPPTAHTDTIAADALQLPALMTSTLHAQDENLITSKPKALPDPQLSTGVRRSLEAEPRMDVFYPQLHSLVDNQADIVPPSRRLDPTNGASFDSLGGSDVGRDMRDILTATGAAGPAPSAYASAMPPATVLSGDDPAEGGCGWTEHRDPVSFLPYYHNEGTGMSTWHEPEELKAWRAREAPTAAGVPEASLPEKPRHEARREDRSVLPPRSRSGSTGVPHRPMTLARRGQVDAQMPSFHEEEVGREPAQRPRSPVATQPLRRGPSKAPMLRDPLLRRAAPGAVAPSRFGVTQGMTSPSSASHASTSDRSVTDSDSDMTPTPPRVVQRAGSLRGASSSARGVLMHPPPQRRVREHVAPTFEEVQTEMDAPAERRAVPAFDERLNVAHRARVGPLAVSDRWGTDGPCFAEQPFDDLDL